MATEKTSLLHNNLITHEKVKECMVVVTIPKQITDIEDEPWSGLTRDQLMTYVDDPYWVNLRKVLMALFWVALFAMFTAAIVIASVEHNGICAPKVKMLNLQGITNMQQPPVDIMNRLSTSTENIDKLNLTNSLVS